MHVDKVFDVSLGELMAIPVVLVMEIDVLSGTADPATTFGFLRAAVKDIGELLNVERGLGPFSRKDMGSSTTDRGFDGRANSNRKGLERHGVVGLGPDLVLFSSRGLGGVEGSG